MKMSTICQMFRIAVLLGVFIVELFITGADHTKSLLQPTAIATEQQSQPGENMSPEYKVTPFFIPQDQKRFAIIYVTVDPKNFNRQDMNAVASKLNTDFGEQARLKAALFDDGFIPQLMVKGGVSSSDFYKAQRGLYYLDRIKCREYIQFSTKKGGPIHEVTIKFKCSTKQSIRSR